MARWGDIGRWVGPTRNSGDGDSTERESADRMAGHEGVIIHIADGYYQGTISWQRNAGAEVSSHFIVGKTPAEPTVQMVDTDDRSWAQRDGNSRWLSIEFVGFTGQKLTDYQMHEAARILVKAHQVYGVPLQVTNNPKTRGLGHHSMGAENGLNWGHSACPGSPIKAQKTAIVALAIRMANGDDVALDIADVQKILTYDFGGGKGRLYDNAYFASQQSGAAQEKAAQGLDAVNQVQQTLDLVLEKLAALAAVPPGSVSLTEGDVQRIATAAAEMLHDRLQS